MVSVHLLNVCNVFLYLGPTLQVEEDGHGDVLCLRSFLARLPRQQILVLLFIINHSVLPEVRYCECRN